MTIWRPDISLHPGPRYKALAQAIDVAIGEGELEPGRKLPPQRDLAYRLGVTVGTVSRAYALAEQRGLVRGEVGRGTFVRANETARSFDNPFVDGDDELIKLTVNGLPDRTVQALVADGLQHLGDGRLPIGELAGYAPKVGLDVHRQAAAAWAGQVGAAFSPETTLITGGAHQALVVALAGLTRPGDVVITEPLVYSGLKQIAARAGVELRGVGIDEEGLRPDALEAACREGSAGIVVLNPTKHNPTVATMSEERRRAIAAIARRHDLVLIEDDVYGHLPEGRPPPLHGFAPERTVYVTSASKIIAPGLRFGVLSAPPDLFRRLADAQSDLFLTCPPLMAALFTQWVDDGTADELLRRQRAEAFARQKIAAECLEGHTFAAKPYAYHIWLPLSAPWRSSTFVDAVRRRGVTVDPAFLFTVGPLPEPHAIRISLSAASTRDRLRRALKIVDETLLAGPIGRSDTI